MRSLAALTLLASLACRAEPAARVGTDVAGRFYETVIGQRVAGAPTPAQLATLAPYLSDTLRALLAAARARSDSDAARNPDEKPAFADGDLFSSLFEGPNDAAVADSPAGLDQGRIPVRLTYRGASPPVTWVDTVVVIRQRGRAVVDDVAYGGTWDFANRGTLRTSLTAALAGR